MGRIIKFHFFAIQELADYRLHIYKKEMQAHTYIYSKSYECNHHDKFEDCLKRE